ncbi:DNA-directed RNA polymerase subunit D [Candidatus Woesearchaeota archaeon]|nr:DNA-directed RNA polymerase subunit D [Candidatus Woesearchaeota archaeon]
MSIKIKVLNEEKKNNKLSFLAQDLIPSYANAIRRLMISEVPTMAIENVEIRKNSSVLYDEVLAHRLGIIPLTTDIKSYNQTSKCTCKGAGCAKCTLKLVIKAKGPKNLYSSDIKSKDPKVKPVSDKFLIAKLSEGQEIEVEATAVLGVGQEHSKWSPAHVYYRYSPIVKIKNQPAHPDAVKQICAYDVFEVKNKKLGVKNEINCTLCNACTEMLRNDDVVISSDDKNFIFMVESWGQLSPKDIVKLATKVFSDKLKSFGALLK